MVTLPYDRLGDEVYGTGKTTQVTTQVATQVTTQVVDEAIQEYENRILEYCLEPKTKKEIADVLGFKERKSVSKYLTPLLEQGRIAMTLPDKPNSSKQKYITIKA
mgnify:CR=1 FL=1